jgi:hypothetical protein
LLTRVELLAHRPELVDRVVTRCVDAVEELGAAHRVEHVAVGDEAVEALIAARHVRLDGARPRVDEEPRLLALQRVDTAARPADLVVELVEVGLCLLVATGGRARGAPRVLDARLCGTKRVVGARGRRSERRRYGDENGGTA